MSGIKKMVELVKAGHEVFVLTHLERNEREVFLSQVQLMDALGVVEDDLSLSKMPLLYETEKGRYFIERLSAAPHLVVLGGGHIALPLCEMAHILDLSVTLVDDREEFANSDRFSTVEQVICGDFEKVLAGEDFGAGAMYVIITRGHSCDTVCLKRILKLPYRYAGMIGSRRKVAQAMDEMRALGFTDEKLAEVHSPIGLSIGAQTPAEIAVSILAQMVGVWRLSPALPLERGIIDAVTAGAQGAKLVTILEKQGSAPRGAGARMLVMPDGRIHGTIGGGSAEYELISHAMRNMGKDTYEELNLDVKSVGMTCGGSMHVLIESLD